MMQIRGKKNSWEWCRRDAALVGWKLPSTPPIDRVCGQQSMAVLCVELQPRLHNVGTLTLQRQCKSWSHLYIPSLSHNKHQWTNSIKFLNTIGKMFQRAQKTIQLFTITPQNLSKSVRLSLWKKKEMIRTKWRWSSWKWRVVNMVKWSVHLWAKCSFPECPFTLLLMHTYVHSCVVTSKIYETSHLYWM